MVDGALFLTFLLAALVLALTPGPDMVYIVAVGVRGGPGAGLMAAVGVATGMTVHALAAGLGLSAVFTALPPLYHALRWAGAAYLVYLAVKAFRDRDGLLTSGADDTGSAAAGTAGVEPPAVAVRSRRDNWRTFRQAMVTNLLNPKVILFNVAFLPQFVNPELGHVGVQFLVLGLSAVVVGLSTDGSIGLLAGRIGGLLRRSRRVARWLNLFAGTVFTALAVRLVVARD